MAFVIGISGVSGAGKTVITKQLAENLQDAVPLFWDDFEDLGIFPDDYVEWFNSSKDYGAWKTPEFAGAIKTLKSDQTYKHPTSSLMINSKKYVVVDAPGTYISFLVIFFCFSCCNLIKRPAIKASSYPAY